MLGSSHGEHSGLTAILVFSVAIFAVLSFVANYVKRSVRFGINVKYAASKQSGNSGKKACREAVHGEEADPRMDHRGSQPPEESTAPTGAQLTADLTLPDCPPPVHVNVPHEQADAPCTPGRSRRRPDTDGQLYGLAQSSPEYESPATPLLPDMKAPPPAPANSVEPQRPYQNAPAPWQLPLPRQRLGPLPFRRPHVSSGTLKQPRGLATCVIREDMPYPPANAEVSLEVRTTTVRHGRRFLRYSSSWPLDTIYIKIPNTCPASLRGPILENLRHTINLGSQRIVVGAGLRPGCALLSLDVACVGGVQQQGDRQGGLPVQGDAGGSGGSGGTWLEALIAVGKAGGGGGGGGVDAAALAELGTWLSRWLGSAGVAVAPGLTLQMQYRGVRVEAVYDGDTATWRFVTAASGPGAAHMLQSPATAPSSSSGAPVQLLMAQQVLVAPSVAGEAVKVSVCVRGLMDAAAVEAEAGGIRGDEGLEACSRVTSGGGAGVRDAATAGGGAGRFSFVVRCLGRHLPVLAVPAPTTPGNDTTDNLSQCEEEEGFEEVVSVSSDDDGDVDPTETSHSTTATATAAAVAATAAAAAGLLGDLEEPYGNRRNSLARNSAEAPSAPRRVPRRVVSLGIPRRGAAPGSGASHRDTPRASSRGMTRQSSGILHEAPRPVVSHFNLTIFGLGRSTTGGNGGGDPAALLSADSGPLLLVLELWSDQGLALATKPLLLLPPSMMNLYGDLQLLVRQQQALDEPQVTPAEANRGTAQQHQQHQQHQQLNDGREAMDATATSVASTSWVTAAAGGAVHAQAAADVGPDSGVVASGSVGVSGRWADSAADQIVTDLGRWLEFVHDVTSQGAAEARPGSFGAGNDTPPSYRTQPSGLVLLPGSVDLRGEVLAERRRMRALPHLCAAELRRGVGLLEALLCWGRGGLAEALVMAPLRTLGYSAADVWRAFIPVDLPAAAAAASPPFDGWPPHDEFAGSRSSLPLPPVCSSLLHLAASSGDLATLQLVTAWAQEAAAAADRTDGTAPSATAPNVPASASALNSGWWWRLQGGQGWTPLHLLAAASDSPAAIVWVLAEGGDAAVWAWRHAGRRPGPYGGSRWGASGEERGVAAMDGGLHASGLLDASSAGVRHPVGVRFTPEQLAAGRNEPWLGSVTAAVLAAEQKEEQRAQLLVLHQEHQEVKQQEQRQQHLQRRRVREEEKDGCANGGLAEAPVCKPGFEPQAPSAAQQGVESRGPQQRQWGAKGGRQWDRSWFAATAHLLYASFVGFSDARSDCSSGDAFTRCAAQQGPAVHSKSRHQGEEEELSSDLAAQPADVTGECARLGSAETPAMGTKEKGNVAGGGTGRVAGVDGTDPAKSHGSVEARYQVEGFVTSCSLPMGRCWVVVHLLLFASVLSRLVRGRRLFEAPVLILHSSGYFVMLAILKTKAGTRLYLRHRGALWGALSPDRCSAKVPHIAGWVALRYTVQRGGTLASDDVLPSLL